MHRQLIPVWVDGSRICIPLYAPFGLPLTALTTAEIRRVVRLALPPENRDSFDVVIIESNEALESRRQTWGAIEGSLRGDDEFAAEYLKAIDTARMETNSD